MAHDHHHGHAHRHAENLSRKLIIATGANAFFVVVELVMGFTAGSLALIGDALHNFTDVVALLLALFAVRLARRPPTTEKSYGYHRAGILAAFVNAGVLVGLTLFLFVEAFQRLSAPHDVDNTLMLITAAVAVLINGGAMLLLRADGRDDVNIRSAVMHMFSDALASVGIIIAALLIRATGNTIWDPAVSILIGVLILWSSWGILRETINLLLEGTPTGIDPAAVLRTLSEIDGVLGVHHLHIWALGPSSPALSCHLMVGDVPLKTTGKVLDVVNEVLAKNYRIAHSTIQFEFANCDANDPYCVPWTSRD
jgi:cobalt-zinc-cadmium efflux system protein